MENAALSVTSTNSTLHDKVDITLDEEIPIGRTVGVFRATNEDYLGDLTFELDPWNVYFAVDREHGTVVTTARLDVERAGFARAQSFSIKACDRDQRCAAIPVTVYVHGINDNAPFCDQYLIRYTGKEIIAKGTVVAKFLCHDIDEPPGRIHYGPSLGPVGSGQLFEQVPTAENFIQVAKELDYENPEMVAAGRIYEMTISGFDDLRASHTAFYRVGRVTATDKDDLPNCVTYKITSGDTQAIQRFWIHPLSGMIELTTQPDYETVKQYNLTVEGVDCDRFQPRTAVTVPGKRGPLNYFSDIKGRLKGIKREYRCMDDAVTVDILDENDEAPVCTPSLHKAVVFDNVDAGTNVNGSQLNCHDRDSQDFEMRFEMVSGG
ncbi:hypothetical protein CB1_000353009 [Camelus ferus]|nr:hypothetical protein CB1_000353009 [Camelus ferus]